MARSTVKERIAGPTSRSTSACGLTTASTERASTVGRTVVSIRARGKPTSYTARAFTLGPMVGDMRVSMSTSARKVSAATTGLMESRTRVNGTTVISTEKVASLTPRAVVSSDCGRMVSASSGSMPRVRCVPRAQQDTLKSSLQRQDLLTMRASVNELILDLPFRAM